MLPASRPTLEQNNVRLLFNSSRFRSGLLIHALLIGFGWLSTSCSLSDEEVYTGPNVNLRFSADTVLFDTVFTDLRTTTRRLKVYNDLDKQIIFSNIGLERPESPFNLTINGLEGKSFSDVSLFGGDSLLILVDATIDSQNQVNPFVVEDVLGFNVNGLSGGLPVIAWGQDANYLKDSVLVCNTTWTKGKPYVLLGDILIDSLCQLNIEAGTKIYAHFGSNIFVKGSINAAGSATDRILFTNDRTDEPFASAPGQWQGITFLEGSGGNSLSYVNILNATNGIWLGTPDADNIADLVIENSIIENMSQYGVLAFTSDIEITNSLIDNCGEVVFAGLAGGNYRLRHVTLANFAYGMFKRQPVLVYTDQLELADGTVIGDSVHVEIANSIIWGPDDDELVLLQGGDYGFTIGVEHTLLKTQIEGLDINGNILNNDPLFLDPGEFNYTLQEGSPAIKSGADIGVLLDLNDSIRVSPPDMGAFEFKQ